MSCTTSLAWAAMTIRFISRVRSPGGRKRIPTMGRFGFRSSRIRLTSVTSTNSPSTGVASTQRRVSMPIECSRTSTSE